ncbi:hypothetical protein JTB14_029018 [Gonioctena quinquepunctata]|nr:hypothetical protein JTB14_029018 [Gonioctena quinquepunctata]
MTYKSFKKSNDAQKAEKWKVYKASRNQYVDMLETKKAEYYEQKMDLNKDYSKQIVKPNAPHNFNKIEFSENGKTRIHRTEIDIAKNFNIFLVKSIQDIADNIIAEEQ